MENMKKKQNREKSIGRDAVECPREWIDQIAPGTSGIEFMECHAQFG